MMKLNPSTGHHTLLLLLLMPLLRIPSAAGATDRKNVLFIAVDDLRPELGAYLNSDVPIHPFIYTPNFDRLASTSLLVKRAYVQLPLCSPSRTSLLTGRRPDTTHVLNNGPYWRTEAGDFTTIPQYFKENGYHTTGMGKIFHMNIEDLPSWSEEYYHAPNYFHYFSAQRSWRAVRFDEELILPLPDQQVADHAIEVLRRVGPTSQAGGEPFFLALGFYKPHLPFAYPEMFHDLYPEESVELPSNPYAPVDTPSIAMSSYPELRRYDDIAYSNATGEINTTLSNVVTRDLRRAYYSCVSYVDSLLGEVLDKLEELGLDNDTVVVLWGDHGWQLGEHAQWGKITNFELSTHAPLMVRVPGLTDWGVVTEELVEHVDIFPTLAEAAGLPAIPLCPDNSSSIEVCTEGTSFMPLVVDPNHSWKQNAFSQTRRSEDGTAIMGYSMRTNRYRYTEWVHYLDAPDYKPDWDNVVGIELYDHVMHPGENWNLVNQLEYQEVMAQLREELHAGWRAAIPSKAKTQQP